MDNNLQSGDYVGMSFWLISMALVAATAFFFVERDRVAGKWKTSLTVSGLVTLIAAVHYFYMRDVWVDSGTSPTEFRYIDWLLTVPLLMVEFYLIMSAVGKVPGRVFWNLLVGTTIMLLFGYAGEIGMMNVLIAFILSMAAWLYVIWYIIKGEASQVNASLANEHVQKAYRTMTFLVTVGWAIYPLGYFLGYLGGGADPGTMNLVYNLADFWNKIGFGIVIWSAAVADSDLA
ncbi:MAG TPA: biphenyl 2,3-dioxygenase [Oceanospirillaceae bacterium]|jgi:bacteriorhodopsin|nr:biphenyl 2,3-dioxygenase [Oceanospirillaceae bacterium]|tara:strand:+ start:861 stop:1556 length:696 start_codon:yes stop_codon:yes gene_type:complete